MILIKKDWFKILAIVLLIIAVLDNPYVYYQVLKWSILIIGSYSSYLAYNNNRIKWSWIFALTALLFNPILPFYFQKETWQFIDIIVAIIFLISIISNNYNKNE